MTFSYNSSFEARCYFCCSNIADMAAFMPAELVAILVEHVHREDQQTFANCLRVSPIWRMEGRAIRWRHISLTATNVEAFIDSLDTLEHGSTGQLQNVLCLIHSVTFYPMFPRSHTTNNVIVSRLIKRLPQMVNLESVSIEHASFSASQSAQGPEDSRNDIQTFFRSLTQCMNLNSLELNFVFCSNCSNNNDNCQFWNGVCVLLPRLRRLRLYNIPISCGLFSSLKERCDNLRELILNISSFDKLSYCWEDFLKPYSDETRRKFMVKAVIAESKRILHAGLIPNISHFVICGTRKHEYTHNHAPGVYDLSFACHFLIDIKKNTTTVYPAYLGPGPWHEPFLNDHPIYADDNAWMLYRNPKTGQVCNFIDRTFQNCHIFVDEPSWWTAEGGVRLPMDIAHTDGCKMLKWLTPQHKDRVIARFKRLRKPGKVQTRLWYWEERVGRPLINIQTFKGVFLPDRPERESPPEEQQFNYFDGSDLANELCKTYF